MRLNLQFFGGRGSGGAGDKNPAQGHKLLRQQDNL